MNYKARPPPDTLFNGGQGEGEAGNCVADLLEDGTREEWNIRRN